MIFQARTARPAIIINGIDYFNQLAPYIVNMTYVDNYDGERADDFSLELADPDRMFISSWMPDKGTFLDASIIASRWFSPNAADLTLDCGRFWIDTVEFKLPEHSVEIKAASIPTDVQIKAGEETRSWENHTLQEIAQQISSENKMLPPLWQSDYNPRYGHIEQVEESGLAFLKKRAEDAKIAIKVHRNQIIFFDEQKLEAQAPAFTILYGNAIIAGTGPMYRMSGGHFVTKIWDTTKKAVVAHSSPATGKMTKAFAESSDPQLTGAWDRNIPQGTDSDEEDNEGDGEDGGGGDGGLREVPGDPNLVGNWTRTTGDAAADRLAQSKVRKDNKEKDKSKIDLSIGNPVVAAGQCCMIVGVGQFDGKYFVEAAHHKVCPEFKTELTVRKCLVGI